MSEYAKRDLIGLAGHYTKHVQAMTAEGLHTKSDIAAELAWRDVEIERLTAERDELRRQFDPMGEEFASADELIAALRAEKAEDEAMKQDARRYRDWLRGGANIPPESTRWPRWEVRHWDGRHWNTLFAEQMDAAIDAAMGGGDAG